MRLLDKGQNDVDGALSRRRRARAARGRIMNDEWTKAIGWVSSALLVLTIAKQVWKVAGRPARRRFVVAIHWSGRCIDGLHHL
jgi:hypothetical protein